MPPASAKQPPILAPTGRYWPALDGLRGLAVLAVMLFHAQVPQVVGGFAGVDIFFVLSGFLITSQLMQELHQSGHIRWGRFFMRRLLRLQPALLLLLLTYILGWIAGWIPGPGSTVTRDVSIVLLAMTHWARALDWYPPDYLGHAWSLGIEEQFYLLWALLLAAMGRYATRRWSVLALALAGTLAGMLWMLWLHTAGAKPVRLYNGLDTRAMALLCGCALASWLHTRRPERLDNVPLPSHLVSHSRAVSYTGMMALALLLLGMSSLEWHNSLMFPWGYMAIAVTATLLVWSLVLAPSGLCSAILAWPPLVAVGKISYGLYLWHYPLFRVAEAKALEADIPVAYAMGLASGLAAMAAWVSFVAVELPLRKRLAWRYRHTA
ncbi:acyltransferase [Acidovorax sp. IB03]|uniref:acyltransferase family protein n=1 Tax=Acidovorax sp. IB03 TaxID=2779366 RepID=UPI0021034EEE|nr:acyltransferase [Acidovorax sp. IB03]